MQPQFSPARPCCVTVVAVSRVCPYLFAALLLVALGCRSSERTLTVALAILPGELPVYESVVQEFQRESGLRVVIVPQQYADIRRALEAEALAGHGTLDLVELDVYALAMSARYARQLDDSEYRSELEVMLPQAVDAGRIDGLRFLPHRVSWQALIYNHAELKRPPETWEELLAVARAHPQRIALKGALYEGLTCDLLTFVWGAGGEGDDLDDDGSIRAFHFLSQLAPYLHPQSAVFKESTIAEAMARGEIVLHLNWPFVMSLYESQGLAPDLIRSAPLPEGPSGRSTVLGGGYLAIPRNAPHLHEVSRLVRFLLSKPTQQRFGRELGWFSARRDVAIEDSRGLLSGFLAMREQVRPRPERRNYLELSRRWQEAFRAVAFRGAEPAATLRAAAAELEGEGRPPRGAAAE